MSGYLLSDGNDISTLFASSSDGYPTGSIMPYLGTTDIDGWILCDGIEVNNNQDGKYNALFNLGIGEGGNLFNKYTPPNLRNYFLRGASTAQSVENFAGNDVVQLGIDQLPSHGHPGTIGTKIRTTSINVSHSHALYNTKERYFAFAADDNNTQECVDKAGFIQKKVDDGIQTKETTLIRSITVPAHNHTLEINSVGQSQPFSILPTFLTVNYLLKL